MSREKQFYQKPGIYKIICIPTGKIYIGSSVNISVRITSHKTSLRGKRHANTYLQRAWEKHGEGSFTFEILEYITEELLLERESYWIQFYKSDSKSSGFNIWTADRGRMRHSEETKRKIGLGNKGKRKGRVVNSPENIERFREMSKQPKSIEHNAKVSKSKTGKKRPPFSEEWKQKLREVLKRGRETIAKEKTTETSGPKSKFIILN